MDCLLNNLVINTGTSFPAIFTHQKKILSYNGLKTNNFVAAPSSKRFDKFNFPKKEDGNILFMYVKHRPLNLLVLAVDGSRQREWCVRFD